MHKSDVDERVQNKLGATSKMEISIPVDSILQTGIKMRCFYTITNYCQPVTSASHEIVEEGGANIMYGAK